jgi:uncharacterized protein (TIGR02145 family)
LITVLSLCSSCSKDGDNDSVDQKIKFDNLFLNPELTYGSVKDIDDNVYPTIKIGNQVWMAENLKTTKYNTSVPIPNVMNDADWKSLSTGAWCYFSNNTENNTTYGKLYNWYVVNTGKLCPKGWHIPTDEEWEQLVTYLNRDAGIKVKSTGNNADGTGLWAKKTGENTEGTNESGLTGLPGGDRAVDGTFEEMGTLLAWWSSTETNVYNAQLRSVNYGNNSLNSFSNDKRGGSSCRCVQD